MRGISVLRVRNLESGRLTFFVSNKSLLKSCLVMLCVVCGVAIMWIGVIWTP
jgi:hypothetical protein